MSSAVSPPPDSALPTFQPDHAVVYHLNIGAFVSVTVPSCSGTIARAPVLLDTSGVPFTQTTMKNRQGKPPGDLGAPDLGTGSNAPEPITRTLERALGNQIRVLRRQHDLSIADLAAAAGISNGMLSKIENGSISASLTTLQSIAAVLQAPLSSLFASFEEPQDCSYVAAGQGVTIERRGTKVGHVYQLLGHVLRGELIVEPYLITLREKAAPYTGFRHAGIEFIHMLEGELEYRHGAERYRLSPGDSLLFDSTAPHGPETLGTKEIRYLSIIVYPRAAN